MALGILISVVLIIMINAYVTDQVREYSEPGSKQRRTIILTIWFLPLLGVVIALMSRKNPYMSQEYVQGHTDDARRIFGLEVDWLKQGGIEPSETQSGQNTEPLSGSNAILTSRPKSITTGVSLLLASTMFAFYLAHYLAYEPTTITFMPDIGISFVFLDPLVLITLVFMVPPILVYFRINWARYLIAGLTVLGLLLYFVSSDQTNRNPFILELVFDLASIFGTVLLFLPSSNKWMKQE